MIVPQLWRRLRGKVVVWQQNRQLFFITAGTKESTTYALIADFMTKFRNLFIMLTEGIDFDFTLASVFSLLMFRIHDKVIINFP
jgi:hypothetical protein